MRAGPAARRPGQGASSPGPPRRRWPACPGPPTPSPTWRSSTRRPARCGPPASRSTPKPWPSPPAASRCPPTRTSAPTTGWTPRSTRSSSSPGRRARARSRWRTGSPCRPGGRPPSRPPRRPCLAGVRCLVFAGPAAQPLLDGLRAAGADVVAVVAGSEYGTAPDGTITVRPAERDDYETLHRRARGVPPADRARLGAGRRRPPADAAQPASRPGRGLLQPPRPGAGAGGGRAGRRRPARHAHREHPGRHRPGRAAGPSTPPSPASPACVPLEARWLAVRHLDLESAAVRPGRRAGGAGRRARRPGRACRRLPSRCARGRRWVRGFEPVPLEPQDDPLRRHGRVRHHRRTRRHRPHPGRGPRAVRAEARLVLLGRSGLPPREEWDDHSTGRRSAPRRAVAAIRRMEAAGAEVLVLAADVTDPAALRRVRDRGARPVRPRRRHRARGRRPRRRHGRGQGARRRPSTSWRPSSPARWRCARCSATCRSTSSCCARR